jgi:hypothetical protein
VTPPLPALIAQVRSEPRLGRVRLEELAGMKLVAQPGTDAFAFYTASARTSDGASLMFDYRKPRPGGGATAGALLNVSVRGVCISKTDIARSYGPLRIIDVPHGHSWDEEFSLGRTERWGELSFGFAERRPDCLSSVSFAYNPQDRG